MSELLRFNKGTGQLFLKDANGGEQVVVAPPAIHKTVFILIDASGSMAGRKFEDAKQGALDFGLSCIHKNYEVAVVAFSSKASATKPTKRASELQGKIARLPFEGNSTYLASALGYATGKQPAYVLVVTDGQISDVERSLELAEELKRNGTEILTIGTDDADTGFLQRLASRSDLGVKVASANLAQAITDCGRLLR